MSQSQLLKQVHKLKSKGEKIMLDFDKCEFKERSYTDEVIDERMTRFNTINLDYGKVLSRDFIGQSLLIYHHQAGDKSEKYVQAFPCSADTLKVHVLKNSIYLYVDPFDRSHYFFYLNDN